MAFFLFFSGYVLSFLGFLLGKATHEEHDEIKKFVTRTIFISYLCLHIALLYFFKNFLLIEVLLIGTFLLYLYSELFFKTASPLHRILLFALLYTSLTNFLPSLINLQIIVIVLLFLENSFKKWNFKEEIYSIIGLLIFYFVFSYML